MLCLHYKLYTYPGVRDNRSTLNTKTGYDDDHSVLALTTLALMPWPWWCCPC